MREMLFLVASGAFWFTLVGITWGEERSVSFSRDLVPILTSQCATCHLAGIEAGKMALVPKKAYANLVNAPSVESKWLRVKPGVASESYIMMKLDGTQLDNDGTGARMPFGGAQLSPETRELFRRWIDAGARDN